MFRYIRAAPAKVRLSHFNGGFRLIEDAAKEAGARAAINFGFFAMSKSHPKGSYPVGQVMVNGQNLVFPGEDAAHFHGVYRLGDNVKLWQWLPAGCLWGVRAGPRLLEGGALREDSITDPAWTNGGIQPTNPLIARVAIGARQGGDVILAYWSGATIRDMARDLLALGCVDALAGDGGGSASWYDSEHPEQIISQRLVPNMIWVEGDTETLPIPTPETGGDKSMIVCIDPGHGGPDPGAINVIEGLREKDIVLNVSMRVAEYLRRKGVKVVLTREKDTDLAPGLDDEAELKARGGASNVAEADYFVSIHVDSFSDESANGATVHYWPNSLKGKPLAQSISDNLSIASGLASRGIKATSFAVLRHADAPAVLVELGFMSNKTDRWVMREPAWQDRVALGIAYGILQAAG